MVFGKDEQRAADMLELQSITRYNGGDPSSGRHRCLLETCMSSTQQI